MKPEEKAKELVEKFGKELIPLLPNTVNLTVYAKSCALICVDEIINLLNEMYTRETEIAVKYFQSVRDAITKM